MPKFVVDKPIETAESRIVVEGGLDAGNHRFQLEVVTSDGRRSAPMGLVLQVRKPLAPDDSVDVVNPRVIEPRPRIRPRPVTPMPTPIDPRPAPADIRPAPVVTRPVRPGPVVPTPTPVQPRPGPSILRPGAVVRPAGPVTPAPAEPATPDRPLRPNRRPGRGDNNPTE